MQEPTGRPRFSLTGSRPAEALAVSALSAASAGIVPFFVAVTMVILASHLVPVWRPERRSALPRLRPILRPAAITPIRLATRGDRFAVVPLANNAEGKFLKARVPACDNDSGGGDHHLGRGRRFCCRQRRSQGGGRCRSGPGFSLRRAGICATGPGGEQTRRGRVGSRVQRRPLPGAVHGRYASQGRASPMSLSIALPEERHARPGASEPPETGRTE